MTSSTLNISNSVAFVTGTNKKNGIGREIVKALLAQGAKKVYATARDAEQLKELTATDDRIVALSLDMTKKDVGSLHSIDKLHLLFVIHYAAFLPSSFGFIAYNPLSNCLNLIVLCGMCTYNAFSLLES